MIALLLWAMLAVFWPLALVIAIGWVLLTLVRLCLGLGMLSLKAVVGTGVAGVAVAKTVHDYRQQGQTLPANGIPPAKKPRGCTTSRQRQETTVSLSGPKNDVSERELRSRVRGSRKQGRRPRARGRPTSIRRDGGPNAALPDASLVEPNDCAPWLAAAIASSSAARDRPAGRGN